MAGFDREQFEVVRRGYDIDQVDEFLVRQAEAWRERLHRAERRIAELETEVVDLRHLGSEVEAARRQQEALTLTFQTAAEAQDEMLAKAERDAAEHRRTIEQEMRQLRYETEAEAKRQLAEAKTENDELIRAAQAEADELLSSGEQRLAERQAEADANHWTIRARYREAEEVLSDKVEELNSMRVALVAGLEAIASGGLSALEGVSDQLAAVGIIGDDESTVTELIDESEAAANTLQAINDSDAEANELEAVKDADSTTNDDSYSTADSDTYAATVEDSGISANGGSPAVAEPVAGTLHVVEEWQT